MADQSQQQQPFYQTKFSMDWLDKHHKKGNIIEIVEFSGYTDGDDWNGWAMPRFPFAEARRVASTMSTLPGFEKAY